MQHTRGLTAGTEGLHGVEMGLTQCAELKFAENKQTISGCKNSLKNQE